jgi:NhaA family Na+:H+ antiporter
MNAPRTHSSASSRTIQPLRDFLAAETAGGAVLVVGAVVGLLWANLAAGSYHDLWDTEIGLSWGAQEFHLSLRHWWNDGLMTLFFLLVGLEIKRELTSGHLKDRRAAMLPVFGALGGMAVPALIYLAFAGGTDARGWGVPVATDIALAVGVATLLGPRVPSGLRTFLLALAVVDDIGGIVVIAVAYSEGVRFAWLALGAVAVLGMAGINRSGKGSFAPVLALGVVLWIALYRAGVHPTLSGVIMGLLTPTTPQRDPATVLPSEYAGLSGVTGVDDVAHARHTARRTVSHLEWVEHGLLRWVTFGIVPLFALANTGVEIDVGELGDQVTSAVSLGVFFGLLLGKPIGVFLAANLAVALRLAVLPAGATKRLVLGVASLAGIGFTVAVFITELAFVDEARLAEAKVAILLASIGAALLGTAILWRRPSAGEVDATVAAHTVR